MMGDTLPFDSMRKFEKSDGSTSRFASIQALEEAGLCVIDDLPYTIRILLESALRLCDERSINLEDIENIASWSPDCERSEIPYRPSRVLLQDFTGVPAVVDIAAMRDAKWAEIQTRLILRYLLILSLITAYKWMRQDWFPMHWNSTLSLNIIGIWSGIHS